jgi:hypothetical protein
MIGGGPRRIAGGGAPPTPPVPTLVALNVASDPTETTVSISWSINGPATGRVEYGTTTGYGSFSTLEPSFLTSHVQLITGLTAGVLYHFRVFGTAADARTYLSADFTFITDSPPVSNIVLTNIAHAVSGASVTWSWNSTPPASGQVEYGLTAAYGNVTTLEPSELSGHVQGPYVMPSSGVWHYRILATTASPARSVASSDRTFSIASTPPPPPPTVTYPPKTTPAYIVPPSMARPSLGVITTMFIPSSPSYSTRITRISTGIPHHYSRDQAWNSNESLIKGEQSGATTPLFSGVAPYEYLGDYDLPSESQWSNLDPDVAYGLGGGSNTWREFSYASGVSTTVRTFNSGSDIYTLVTLGWNEGTISDDDRYVALYGENGATKRVFLYDRQTDTVLARKDTGDINNCTVARVGSGGPGSEPSVIICYNADGTSDLQGTWQYSRSGTTLNTLRQLNVYGGRHEDPGLDYDGSPCIFQAASNTTTAGASVRLTKVNLVDGTRTLMLSSIGEGNSWNYAGHCSGRSNRRGIAYFSVENRLAGRIGDDQVVAMESDGSAQVQIFAFSHLTGSTYEHLPKVVPNRAGDKVLINSKWNGVSGTVDAYIAHM